MKAGRQERLAVEPTGLGSVQQTHSGERNYERNSSGIAVETDVASCLGDSQTDCSLET